MGKEMTTKEIPTAKIYDISNAIKITWEYENCGWCLENLPKGSQLIIPNHEV